MGTSVGQGLQRGNGAMNGNPNCYHCGVEITGAITMRPKDFEFAIKKDAPFASTANINGVRCFMFCCAQHAVKEMPVQCA